MLKSNSMSTRNKYVDLIFGVSKTFELNQFPTNSDVLKNILFLTRDKSLIINKSYQPIFNQTAQRVNDVWIKTGIPIISNKSIERKVARLYSEYQMVIKFKSRPHEFQKKATQFREAMEKTLFNIASCQCESQCKCPYGSKVPLKERQFLSDQKSTRLLFLTSVDKRSTTNAEIQMKRNAREKKSSTVQKKKPATNDVDFNENITPNRANSCPSVNTKYKKLKNVSREMIRCGVSLSNAATLFNALLKDLGLANEQNLIDRNQLQRNKSNFRKYIANEHNDNIRKAINDSDCCGIYFDGKKDNTKTFVINPETSKPHPRTSNEEHYTMVLQPHNLYYAHVAPTSSQAKPIADSIVKRLKDDRIDVNKIKFVGSDGTNTNTGESGGKFNININIL